MADFEFKVNLQADKLVQQAISNANANRALAETTRVKTKQIKAVVDDLILPAVTGDKDKTNQGVRRDLDDPAAHRIERLEPTPTASRMNQLHRCG